MSKRVLVAIDDAGSREETARNLKCWGYEVVVAADGIRTFDLGGDESTSGVVDEVVRRVRHELIGAP